MEQNKRVIFQKEDGSTVEFRKFNPFHDSLGRFASAHGFKTYSANPKTRAGALAIQRSNADGHGRTLNVHAQSKGESVRQNANWLATGQKPKVPAAVSRARYQQRKLQQQQAQQQGQNQAAQSQQKPAQAAKPAAQAKPKSTGHQMVEGKDISKTFRTDPKSSKKTFDQVTEQQGFNKKPRVVDQADFDAAVKASGLVAYRTWNPGVDGMSGKSMSATDFKNQFKNADTLDAAGNGMRAFGGGIYTAATKNPKKGVAPNQQAAQSAKSNSQVYGGRGRDTAAITLDPSAKIANHSKISKQFWSLSRNERDRFGGDEGTYAAALGYDAMRVSRGSCDYLMIYNRTKAIVLND